MIFEEGHLRVSLEVDSPEAHFDSKARARAETPAKVVSEQGPRRALVEVHRRVGGLPQRAVVGGMKSTTGSGYLVVEAGLSGESVAGEDRKYPGVFGRELSPGIPSEFAASVLRGLLTMRGCAGLVEVDCGAFDVVESSGAAFELAATILAVALEHDPLEAFEAVRQKVKQLA